MFTGVDDLRPLKRNNDVDQHVDNNVRNAEFNLPKFSKHPGHIRRVLDTHSLVWSSESDTHRHTLTDRPAL